MPSPPPLRVGDFVSINPALGDRGLSPRDLIETPTRWFSRIAGFCYQEKGLEIVIEGFDV